VKVVELSRATGTIAAPVERVWRIMTDFAHPQRLAKSIEQCDATGNSVGDTRIVTARGRVIHERIEEIDLAAFRFSYRALDTGDMPMAGIRSYLATVTLRPRSDGVTDIEWRSEGDFEGDLDEIATHFEKLYSGAIANLRQEAE
jgi:uncharacterized protein YndB with AHSA1/START domain